jgi:predicted DNA-binding WGR domain protein
LCGECHTKKLSIVASVLPGGYIIGERVRSKVNFEGKQGNVTKGDIGTVTGRGPDKDRITVAFSNHPCASILPNQILKALPKLTLGDHLKACSGKQFINADGKEFGKDGDQGTVINLYTTDKGEECVKIVWDRTGNTSTMRMAVWMDCFEFMQHQALPKLALGDRLKARPGHTFINADGKELYKEGDQGTVAKFYLTDESEERMRIVWDRTGSTSTVTMAVWMQHYELMQHQALPKLALGDRLKARPGKKFINADGKEFYKEGDQGTLAKFYFTDESEERMEIVWDRTGSTSTIRMAVWMQYFEFMHHQTRTATVTFEPGPSDMRMTPQDGTVTEVNTGQAKEKGVMPGGTMDCIDVISISV